LRLFSGEVYEVKKVNALAIADTLNPEGRQRYSRYIDFAGKYEPMFPNYNANYVFAQRDDIIASEGPADQNARSRLFENTVFAKNADGSKKFNKPFAYLALGPDQEEYYFDGIPRKRSKYQPYCDAGYTEISEMSNLKCIKISEKLQVEEEIIFCFQIPTWLDMNVLKFTDFEAAALYQWLDDPSFIKVIHCSAGLGRTGTLLLAYALAKKYDDFSRNVSDQELGERVATMLYELRQRRPGLVQTTEQLKMAIDLALQFNEVKNTLLLQSLNSICENSGSRNSSINSSSEFSSSLSKPWDDLSEDHFSLNGKYLGGERQLLSSPISPGRNPFRLLSSSGSPTTDTSSSEETTLDEQAYFAKSNLSSPRRRGS
jgi:hypothetical protein